MKQVFFIITLFFSFSSFAQVEFSPQGAEWYAGSYTLINPATGQKSYDYTRYRYEGVTLNLDGYDAKIIESGQLVGDLIVLRYDTIAQTGDSILIRHNGTFELLYNFGAPIGDTVRVNNWVSGESVDMIVQEIDTVEINGVKLVNFTYDVGIWGMQVINNKFGALNLDFLGFPGTFIIDYSTFTTFRCYSDDEFSSYQIGDVACDSLVVDTNEPRVLDVLIYPNPVTTTMYIDFNIKEESLRYQIIDLLGKQIELGAVKNRKIDVNFLSNGTYIVELKNAEGLMVQHQFVKR